MRWPQRRRWPDISSVRTAVSWLRMQIGNIQHNLRECASSVFLAKGSQAKQVRTIMLEGLIPLTSLWVRLPAEWVMALKIRNTCETEVLVFDTKFSSFRQ